MAQQMLTSTARRPASPLFTEAEAANYLKFTPRALQAWRCRGGGPRFVKVSARAVRYRQEDLDHWVETRLRTSTSDPGQQW
jgi:predicted DNA-binding transcriptional regulator AlpA